MTVKTVYAFCLLGLMAICGITTIVWLARNDVHLTVSQEQPEITFAAQFPFEEDIAADAADKQTFIELIGQYHDAVLQVTDNLNQYLTMHTPLADKIKKLQSVFPIYTNGIVLNGNNPFVILPNGYLAGCFEYCPSPQTWDNILDFSAWLEDRGVAYLTLITPDKSDDSVTEFPAGVPHGYNQMVEEYETFLTQNALPYIEAKQTLLAENDDFYAWFYKSDHHWNAHAGFSMARETARFLNEELSIPADAGILFADDWALAVYRHSFLGSYGKKLGSAWVEDMEVLYPTTATDFRIVIPGEGVDRTGNFEEAFINLNLLGKGSTSYYSAFLSGDHALVQIENKNCQNGTRVLVIKFSFANVYCPYLAHTVQYVDMIDPRSFDGSIRSYIEQTKPDAVILCMGVVTEYDAEYLRLK